MAQFSEDVVDFLGASIFASFGGLKVAEGKNGAVFKLDRNPSHIDYVALKQVPAPPADVFDVYFFKVNKWRSCVQLVAQAEGVTGVDLVSCFRDNTGMTRECASCDIQCGCCSL